MTHTYETLTEELVTQYAKIWSYERLRKAYRNIDDQICDLAREIREMNFEIAQCGRNIIKAKHIIQEQNKKHLRMQKAQQYLMIIESELVVRETPLPGNTAQGIYGRFR